MPTKTTSCHPDGGARSLAQHSGSEMVAPVENPEERKRREARKSILIAIVASLFLVALLLCGLFIPGLPRWARERIFAPEVAGVCLLMFVFGCGFGYVTRFGWYFPFNGKKPEEEVTGADLC